MTESALALKSSLDFSSAQSYDLTIKVSDGDPTHDVSISGSVSVRSVDDGPPAFATGNIDLIYTFLHKNS